MDKWNDTLDQTHSTYSYDRMQNFWAKGGKVDQAVIAGKKIMIFTHCMTITNGLQLLFIRDTQNAHPNFKSQDDLTGQTALSFEEGDKLTYFFEGHSPDAKFKKGSFQYQKKGEQEPVHVVMYNTFNTVAETEMFNKSFTKDTTEDGKIVWTRTNESWAQKTSPAGTTVWESSNDDKFHLLNAKKVQKYKLQKEMVFCLNHPSADNSKANPYKKSLSGFTSMTQGCKKLSKGEVVNKYFEQDNATGWRNIFRTGKVNEEVFWDFTDVKDLDEIKIRLE
jgi:hypothetical protein